MLIVAPLVPLAHFMDEREPAAIENDCLGAAAKLLGRDRGRAPRQMVRRVFIHDAGRIA